MLSSLVRAFSSGKRQQVDGASVDIYGEGSLLAQIWHKVGPKATNKCARLQLIWVTRIDIQFLSLSSDHAQWNSRRVAFGMIELVGDSGLEAMRADETVSPGCIETGLLQTLKHVLRCTDCGRL